MKRAILILCVFCLLISGCAASVTQTASPVKPLNISHGSDRLIIVNITGSPWVIKSDDWPGFKGLWYENLRARAEWSGRRLVVSDDTSALGKQPATLLGIFIYEYRWVSSVSRYMVGIMTGDAHIKATVRYVDLQTGANLGEYQFQTSSSWTEGIFSAMTEKQVEAICRDIMAKITP